MRYPLALGIFCACSLALSPVHAGRFEGKSLMVDLATETVPPIVNDSVRVVPSVAQGEVVTFDLFVAGANGLSIEGIHLVFENPKSGAVSSFSDRFLILSVEGLVGRIGETRGAVASIFNGGGRTIGANGYIATVRLRALAPIAQGTVVRLDGDRSYIVEGGTFQNDPVDVSGANFSIGNPEFVATLDLNAAPGNQGRDVRFGVSGSSKLEIELHGSGIANAVGFIFEFKILPEGLAQSAGMSFSSFEAGTVFTTPRTLPGDTTATSVTVTIADLGGPIASNTGLIGKIIFNPSEALKETRISLVRGEMLRGGRFLFSGTSTVRVVNSIDFDESGKPDFRDFLLFASAFNSASGGTGFDVRFDLDADGSVGLSDLTILAAFFNPQATTAAAPVAVAP